MSNHYQRLRIQQSMRGIPRNQSKGKRATEGESAGGYGCQDVIGERHELHGWTDLDIVNDEIFFPDPRPTEGLWMVSRFVCPWLSRRAELGLGE